MSAFILFVVVVATGSVAAVRFDDKPACERARAHISETLRGDSSTTVTTCLQVKDKPNE